MAEFKIEELEGTRYVEIHLNNEMIRAEAGALCYMTGDINMHSVLIPSVGGVVKSIMADEAIFRPTYTGTGVITLESSLGGFHVLDLHGESWILERGTYWASEGSVDVSYHRERLKTSIWAGEGPVYLQTRVKGYGKVIVTTRGPVQELSLDQCKRVCAEGKHVICRTGDVSFTVQRSTKNFMGRFTSGEGLVRVFEGSGKILLNPAPYWRYRVFAENRGDADRPSAASI